MIALTIPYHTITGALASSLMESTLIIQDGIGEKLALAVQFTCSFVFGLAVALYYCWELALLICAIVPIFVALIGFLSIYLTSSTAAASDAYNNAGSIAQEALGAIRTVLGFNGEDRTIKSYVDKLLFAERAGIQKWLYTAVLVGLVTSLMWMMYGLGLWFGAKLIADDMDAHDYCEWRLKSDGTTYESPSSRCVSGAYVLCVLYHA